MDNNITTSPVSVLEELREKVYADMLSKWAGKTCRYNSGLEEKAYFSCEDAMRIVRETDSGSLIKVAERIFNRFIHHV